MKKLLLLFLLLPLAHALTVSDYLQLVSNTPNCGSILNNPTCETVYKILNPSGIAFVINSKQLFNVTFRDSLDPNLKENISKIQTPSFELDTGGGYQPLDFKSISFSLPPAGTALLRIRAKKVWEQVANSNEWTLPNVDNVVCIAGFCDTANAWWNNSYSFKKNFTSFIPQAFLSNSTFIFNTNLSAEVDANKVDVNGTCFRIVDQNETGELPFEHEQSNLSITNYTAFVFNNFTTANTNYTFWGYYSNLGTCSEGNGNINYYWNYTGAAIVSHFAFDKVNGSSFYDSAGGDQNFTIVGSLPLVKTPLGMGFQRSANGNYALGSGKKFNNYPQGTVLLWVNFSSGGGNSELIIRGNATSGGTYDFGIRNSTGKLGCSLNNFTNVAVDSADLNSNKWYQVACTWNSTGVFLYKNGNFISSNTVFTAGLVNSPFITQLTMSQGIGFSNVFTGAMTELMIFNRTLLDEEIQLIYNSSMLVNGIEYNLIQNQINITVFDEISGEQIHFNATFSNGTSTLTTPNTNFYTANSTLFPQGSNTITINNASYYTAILFQNINNNSLGIIGYLIPRSATITTPNFHVQGQTQNIISGAIITLQRSIGGSWVTLRQCSTDSTGTCALNMEVGTTYQIIVTANGYNTPTQSITPTVSTTDYTITLSSVSNLVGYPSNSYGISLSLEPPLLNLIENWTIVNFTVNDSQAGLSLYGMNISYLGSIIFSQNNNSPNFGGSVAVNLSSDNRVGNFSVTYFYQKTGQNVIAFTKSYYIYQNFTAFNYSVSNVFESFRIAGASPFFAGSIMIITTSIIVGGVNSALAVGFGTGLLAVGVLAFLMPLLDTSPYSWLFILFLALVAIALARIRSGVY